MLSVLARPSAEFSNYRQTRTVVTFGTYSLQEGARSQDYVSLCSRTVCWGPEDSIRLTRIHFKGSFTNCVVRGGLREGDSPQREASDSEGQEEGDREAGRGGLLM